jgi:hypothetical protein
MKKIKYIALTVFAGIILLFNQGCEKVLDIERAGALPKDSVFNSQTNVKALLNSVYTVMGSANWTSGRVQKFNELQGDHYYGTELGGTSSEIFLLNSGRFNSETGGFYKEAYIAIQRCNQILENLNSLGDYKDNAEGQAKFVRAFAHFDVVKLYAQPYGFTADNSHVGIPLRVSSAVSVSNRATVKLVYDQIIADLQDAAIKLPSTNGIYPTKWAAKALLARVYFQMNSFQNAYTNANDVITTGKNVSGANLTFDALVTTRFSVAGSNESIFTIANEGGSNQARSNGYRGAFLSINGNPEMRLTNDFYTAMTSNANDARKNAWYDTGSSANFKLLKKFDQLGFIMNLLHLTEMKLIRAESAAELNTNLSVAIQDLNDIRTRAYGNSVSALAANSTATTLRDVARAEREKELVGEGDRVQQLKRRGAKGETITIRTAVWNCPGLILQFSSSEVDNSPGMSYNPEGGCL